MYVIVSELDDNRWLCYDSLSGEYYWKNAWDYRAIKCAIYEILELHEIPSRFAFKVKKLVLVDVEV